MIYYQALSLQIYDKYKHEQAKEIICNKFTMDSNTFLFDTVKPEIVHIFLYARTISSLVRMARKDPKTIPNQFFDLKVSKII